MIKNQIISDKIEQVRQNAENICRNSELQWFIEAHLNKVLKNAEWLLDHLPEANREITILSVWLHDIIYFLDPSKTKQHADLGARKTWEMMIEAQIPTEIISIVFDAVRCHSCKEELPQFLEGKILATADAMAHMSPDFFLSLVKDGGENGKLETAEFKKYALHKLERDFNGQKIFFDFAKEHIRSNYEKIKAFFEIAD